MSQEFFHKRRDILWRLCLNQLLIIGIGVDTQFVIVVDSAAPEGVSLCAIIGLFEHNGLHFGQHFSIASGA